MGERADEGRHGMPSVAVIAVTDPDARQRVADVLGAAGIRTLVASDLQAAASGLPLAGSVVVTDACAIVTLASHALGDPTQDTVSYGAFTLDRARRAARWHGHELGATASQFRVLEALVLAAGDVVSLADLAEALYGDGRGPGDQQRVRSHVKRLRRTLADVDPAAAQALVTVHGSGLCLVSEATGGRADRVRPGGSRSSAGGRAPTRP